MDRPSWYPEGTLEEPFEPQNVSNIAMAFPANVSRLLPPVEAIPDEFGTRNPARTAKSGPDLWLRFQGEWFYKGIKKSSIKPNKGVDLDRAIRHLSAIQGSFEPKHEYKVAAVAFLASLWFKGWKS